MKHLKTKTLILFFLMISFVSLGQTNQNQTNEKYELLNVEVYYLAGVSGIYIFHKDKDVEFVEMDRIMTKAKISQQGKKITEVFQRLYNEGWVIENSVAMEGFSRYIFKRKL